MWGYAFAKHGAKRGVEYNKKDGVEHGVPYHSKTWGCIQLDYGVKYGVEKHGVIIF